MGLVAASDFVVAAEGTKFGFAEVRLGIVPAAISPFVIAKIGVRNARRFFLTGEIFDAARAKEIGLVHDVAPAQEIDRIVAEICDGVARCGPSAVAESKRLIRDVLRLDRSGAAEHTADLIARVRTSPEGQEGLRAFLDKRKPSWMEGKGADE